MAWQKDLMNLDMTKPDGMKQLKLDVKVYYQDRNALCNSAHDYQKSELQDAVNAAALTSDEQQLWNQFQSTFTEKCKTACSNYRATPTFAAFPYIVEEVHNIDPKNPAVEIQVKMEEQIAINANISAFKLLERGCLYEFLNVLLSKRNDTDSALSSFNQLQDKLN